MKTSNKIFPCVAAFVIALMLIAAGDSPKKESVQIEKIAFVRADHKSEELLELIDDTFARIRRGEEFRGIVEKVSDFSVNDSEHWVDPGAFIQPIQNALKRLEPGETSDLIVTDKTYFIVKLVRRSKASATVVK